MTEAEILTAFRNGDSAKRISIVFHYLPKFKGMVGRYRERLIDDLWEETQMNMRGNHGDLGVRVQTSMISDPTYRKAVTISMIEEMIDSGRPCNDVMEYVDDEVEVKERLAEYVRIRKSVKCVNQYVADMYGREKALVSKYLSDIDTRELAKEFEVERHTIRQKIYRITLRMQKDLEPDFKKFA